MTLKHEKYSFVSPNKNVIFFICFSKNSHQASPLLLRKIWLYILIVFFHKADEVSENYLKNDGKNTKLNFN